MIINDIYTVQVSMMLLLPSLIQIYCVLPDGSQLSQPVSQSID